MLKRMTVAGEEPVSLAEAKVSARVDGDELDALIPGYIAAAREQAEHITGRVYRGGVWRWTGSDWPSGAIAIDSVDSAMVKRWSGSALVSVDGSAFVCAPAASGRGTEVVPVLGTSWPDLPSIAAGARVQIDFTLTREVSAVADCVKTYIQAQVAGWVNNPEGVTTRQLQMDPRLARLLDQERLWL
ncbi:MAG: phage gp6-like head-tail connector protein [Rubrivivax sp.]|nr:MAG: phage gp6-like head-tail connector protein [Rubrivivax sp.]